MYIFAIRRSLYLGGNLVNPVCAWINMWHDVAFWPVAIWSTSSFVSVDWPKVFRPWVFPEFFIDALHSLFVVDIIIYCPRSHILKGAGGLATLPGFLNGSRSSFPLSFCLVPASLFHLFRYNHSWISDQPILNCFCAWMTDSYHQNGGFCLYIFSMIFRAMFPPGLYKAVSS